MKASITTLRSRSDSSRSPIEKDEGREEIVGGEEHEGEEISVTKQSTEMNISGMKEQIQLLIDQTQELAAQLNQEKHAREEIRQNLTEKIKETISNASKELEKRQQLIADLESQLKEADEQRNQHCADLERWKSEKSELQSQLHRLEEQLTDSEAIAIEKTLKLQQEIAEKDQLEQQLRLNQIFKLTSEFELTKTPPPLPPPLSTEENERSVDHLQTVTENIQEHYELQLQAHQLGSADTQLAQIKVESTKLADQIIQLKSELRSKDEEINQLRGQLSAPLPNPVEHHLDDNQLVAEREQIQSIRRELEKKRELIIKTHQQLEEKKQQLLSQKTLVEDIQKQLMQEKKGMDEEKAIINKLKNDHEKLLLQHTSLATELDRNLLSQKKVSDKNREMELELSQLRMELKRQSFLSDAVIISSSAPSSDTHVGIENSKSSKLSDTMDPNERLPSFESEGEEEGAAAAAARLIFAADEIGGKGISSEEKIEKLKQLLSASSKRFDSTKKKHESLRQQNQSLIEKNRHLELCLSTIEAELNQKFEERLSKVESSKSELKNSLDFLKDEYNLYKIKAQTALKHKQSEIDQVAQLRDTISSLEQQMSQQKLFCKELQDHNHELQGFEASCKAMASEIKHMQVEKSRLIADLEALHQQFK